MKTIDVFGDTLSYKYNAQKKNFTAEIIRITPSLLFFLNTHSEATLTSVEHSLLHQAGVHKKTCTIPIVAKKSARPRGLHFWGFCLNLVVRIYPCLKTKSKWTWQTAWILIKIILWACNRPWQFRYIVLTQAVVRSFCCTFFPAPAQLQCNCQHKFHIISFDWTIPAFTCRAFQTHLPGRFPGKHNRWHHILNSWPSWFTILNIKLQCLWTVISQS